MNINNTASIQSNAFTKTAFNNNNSKTAQSEKNDSFQQTMQKANTAQAKPRPSDAEIRKHLTLADPNQTHTVIGNFRKATIEEAQQIGESKGFATRFEAAVFSAKGHQNFDDYYEMTKDPQKVIDRSKEGYENYKALSKKALATLNELDSTNSYNISITSDHSIKIALKDGARSNASNSADYQKMRSWIADNETELGKSAKAYSDYALSKSIKDYEDATGINRQVLEDRSLVPIEGREGAYKASAAELDEYLMKMMRYANNAFSNTPKSYAQIDAWGHPGYPIHSPNKPEGSLPNMT